ncbi:MAG: SOS response-associated peptidase [Roseiflexaceae bacterium]
MCGRYSFVPNQDFAERFQVENQQLELLPRYNVAPGQAMPVITRNSPNRVEEMRWGLVPFWAKDPRIGNRMINARAETIAEKPAFRRPLAARRCLVPANGFYEWQRSEEGKLPHYIFLRDTDSFAFAGLYEIWKDDADNVLRTYTIITTTPNALMEPIHNRMPVILGREDEALWLDKAAEIPALLALLRPYPAELMDAYPVSRAVNSPANEGEALIEPEPAAG